MFGWIPLVLLMFAMMPSLRATSWAFVLGYLFLPMAGYSISGLPEYTKITATTYSVLLGTIIFDPNRYKGLRFCWMDLIVAIGVFSPGVSSLTNDIGLYDAMSVTFVNTMQLLVPYALGRMYIRSLSDLKTVGSIIIIASLIYVPLVVYEIRMSPQIHRIVYGFYQHSLGQSRREGSWRPMVFMQHGLMLSMWMATATLIAFNQLKNKAVMGKLTPWMGVSTLIMFVVTVLCKSTGATVLMLFAMMFLLVQKRSVARWLLFAVMLFPLTWTVLRTTGIWSGDLMLNAARSISKERAGSLRVRLNNENSYSAKAMQRPIFGWSGYGARYFPVDEERMGQRAIPDGYWIILLGKYGWVGLGAWLAMGIMPCWILIRKWPVKYWAHPEFSIVVVIVTALACYQIDGIFNAMRITFWTFVIGGLMTLFKELGKPAERVQMKPMNAMKAAG